MGKKQGGKKKHRGKKQGSGDKKLEILKGDDQEYAKVIERKGGPIMSVRLLTGKTINGVIRGNMRKRAWMKSGDIILVCIRDFQKDKVDIVHVYPGEHVHDLVNLGEIPESFTINEGLVDTISNNQDIFGDGGESSFSNEEEWETKYNKLKNGWELYIQQGNVKKAKDMKDRMNKLMTKKPNNNIPVTKQENFDFDFDTI
jgi:translation initiation factor 1A